MRSPGPDGPTAVVQARALAALVVGSALLQGSFDRVIGSDGFFHIRQAERVFSGGMPWMPGTVFDLGWVDHQLGFHLLLWPFAASLPPLLAAKAGAAVLAAVAVWAAWRFAVYARMPAPWAVALLPLASGWLYWLRLEMPRAQALSVALLIACLAALRGGRPRVLAGLCFVYAWTYHVALVALPIAAGWAAVEAARRRSARPIALPCAAALGLAAGWTLHPHSPGTWRFLHQHVVLKVLNEDRLPVGLEWSDGGLAPLLQHGWGALAALGLAGLLLIRATRREVDSIALFGLAAASTAAVLVGTKFVEYAQPLAFLALGAAARDARIQVRRPLVVGAVALGLAASGAQVRDAVLRTEPDPHRLSAALDAVREHAQPGDRVYHFSWNDFPELVLHGPEFAYVVGLDPHFLALHDPERWALYDAIGGGYEGLRSQAIATSFGARLALLVLPYPGAEAALARDPGLHLLWSDPHAVLYAVEPPTRSAPVPPRPR